MSMAQGGHSRGGRRRGELSGGRQEGGGGGAAAGRRGQDEWVSRGGGGRTTRMRRRRHHLCASAAFVLLTVGIANAAWTDQATVLSVMTGSTSEFPGGSTVGDVKLPATLQDRYKQPESFHPNLRFWYTPDVFEEAGTADGASVASWRNVANICHPTHASGECTDSMKQNGENMAVEALVQTTGGSQPVWKRELLNGRGFVRFTRGSTDGTSGQFLEMHTTSASGTPGFTTNPLTSNTNSYTIMMVVRVNQAIADTGDHGILNLALATSDATLNGLSIFVPSVTCLSGEGLAGLGCSGTTCTACNSGKYTTFGTFSALFGSTPTADDNSCNSVCSAGCDVDSPPAGCLSTWGPTNYQEYHGADAWHTIAIRVSGGTMNTYIDGYVASSTAPLTVTGETAASIEQLRIGLKDAANSAAAGFGSIDVAEILVYDQALTVQEMDRLGNYLSVKFVLRGYRLNTDVGSDSRTAAVSKGCGCGAVWWAPATFCSTSVGPYCPAGTSLASGTCLSKNQEIHVTKGVKYLGLPAGVGVDTSTKGGTTVTITGYFLFPTDFDVQGTSGILGASSVAGVPQIDTTTTLASLDTQINPRYLAVAVASVPLQCRTPHGTVNCLAKDTREELATECRVASYPSAGTNDAATACASWEAPSPIPTIVCDLPAGIGAGRDLVIYWHGVGTVLSGFVNYEGPRIKQVVPNHVLVTGGETVTIVGENFGSQAKYSLQASGGTKHRSEDRAVVRIMGRQPHECRSTTWVSDSSLKCVVPPLPMVSQSVNEASRTVEVGVAVKVGGRQSDATSSSILTYTGVPAYYSCDNNRVFGNTKEQEVCFRCCRTACIKDAISSGSSLAGHAFDDCESRCNQFCGYSSRGKARRLVRLRRLLEWHQIIVDANNAAERDNRGENDHLTQIPDDLLDSRGSSSQASV